MKKVITGAIGLIIVLGGIVFVMTNNKDTNDKLTSTEPQSTASPQTESNPLDPNNYTEGADIGETLDATGQKEANIVIDDFVFKTTYLKISKGTKVTWTNEGQIGHNVTSNSSSPKSGLSSEILNNGGSYSFTFDETGLYEYFCTPHPGQMRGVITVVE